MKLITLLITFLLQHRAREQAEALKEAGHRAAEKGLQVAFTGLALVVAAGFFFSAVLLGIVEMGLQIDRQEFLNYSGLMISATTLLGLSLVLVLISYFSLRPRAAAPPPPPPPKSEIVTLLESIAANFLRDFQNQQNGPR